MKRILLAAALIAATSAPALADEWWVLYRSNLSTGVLDSCKLQSPASSYALATQAGYLPTYLERDDGVDVVYQEDPNGSRREISYYRTREACLAQAQIEITNAEKYR